MNIVKIFLTICLIFLFGFTLSNEVLAAPQHLSAEGEYRLGDRDTRERAKKAALTEAKRRIIEQAGIYIESYTEVNNFQVTKDQIKTYANAMIKIKSERVEFYDNGTLCKAFVTAVLDVSTLGKPKLIDNGGSDSSSKNKKRDTDIFGDIFGKSGSSKKKVSIDLIELEQSRTKIINNLSKATSFTAASEYKLQEVTGMTNIGHYDEKGSIANELHDASEIKKIYRFAELNSFVNEAGAAKIINILETKNQQKDSAAKERLTWAKSDRVKATDYKNLVIKEATALFKKINKLLNKADGNERDRLQVMRIEADDAVKLAKALDVRNKAIDKVVKNYEKFNKIVAPKK